MAVPNKLPRGYFRKRASPLVKPYVQTSPKTSTLTPGARTGRRAFWAQFADDLSMVSRSTHIGRTADWWAYFKTTGHLDKEVAILVDGSVTRAIEAVKLGGEIIIQEPAELGLILQAVSDALQIMENRARAFKKTGRYERSFAVFADNSVLIDNWNLFYTASGQDQLTAQYGFSPDTFFTIVNYQPYAAKQERLRLPDGIVYSAWKAMREKYGAELAVRFRYYIDGDGLPIANFGVQTVTTGRGSKASSSDSRTRSRYQAGKPLSFPALNIGQPGAFNSGASPIIIKAARQARR